MSLLISTSKREVNRQMGPTHMSDGNIHHFWMLISCGISHLGSSFTWHKPLRITTLTVLLMSAWAELNCSTAYVALQKCHEHHVPSSCVNRIRILHKMTLLIWQNTLAKYKLFHSSQPATATGICASTKVLSPIRKILEHIRDIDVSFLTTRPCTLDSSSNRMLPPWLASKTLGWYSGTGLKKDRCAALASSFFCAELWAVWWLDSRSVQAVL